MLGRSLASNPFFPKDVIKALKRVEKEVKIIAEVKKQALARESLEKTLIL